MLRPQLPGRILRASAQDAKGALPQRGIELVHRLSASLPALPVQLAPQGRSSDRLQQQLRDHHATLARAEAGAPQPFAQAHGQRHHFAGVVGRRGESRRRPV